MLFFQKLVTIILITGILVSCTSSQENSVFPSPPGTDKSFATAPIHTPTSSPIETQVTHPLEQIGYTFPASIDPSKQYMFYLHGKIIEDQGLPAVSPEFGEYAYEAILEAFSEQGFVVISEQREKNTNSEAYARKVKDQVETLMKMDVPAKNITVVGASKGGWITVFISHYLKNQEINFVLLAICNPVAIETFKQNKLYLYGNVLSIYDYEDVEYAGSCQELFAFSEGQGLSRHDEIVLEIGTGHGVLYQPLDAWINPVTAWAKTESD
jgi:hypothetical protein